MRRAIRVFLILLLAGLPAASFSPVEAANCEDSAKIFSSAYDVTVALNDHGVANISQKISLKNLEGGCFASEYSLKINSTKVKDVSGEDSLGPLSVNLSKDATSTVVLSRLNDEVIGKDKIVTFVLHYTIEDLATKDGFIWSLIVPKITTSETVTAFSFKIVAPVSFGKIFSVSEAPDNIAYEKDQTILNFARKEATSPHIIVRFGAEQEISFKFKVPLENRRFLSQKFFINLPPDTDTQQILIKKLTPWPEKIITDKNGNYFAEYKVAGRKSFEATIEGTVKIIGEGKNFKPPIIFSESELAKLKSSSGDFIQVQDRSVQAKAKELKTVGSIYSFVVNYLSFDAKGALSGKAERKGAANLLRKSQPATNIDFVDLFVAIARAAEVPSREVFGFVISGDPTLRPTFIPDPLDTSRLQVWVQTYDYQKGSWISLDPTWGRTSGITYLEGSLPDRIALFFSDTGEDMAGLKNLTVSSENSEIFVSPKRSDFSPKIDLKVDADQLVAGFPSQVTAQLENKSGVSITAGKIEIAAKNANLVGVDTVSVPVILPFEKKIYKFKLSSGNYFGETKGEVKVSFKGKSGENNISLSTQKNVVVKAFFSFGFQQVLFIILLFLLVLGIGASRIKAAKS